MPKTRRRGTRFVAVAIFFALIAIAAVPALADQGTAGIPLPPPPPSDSGGGDSSAGSTTGYPNASEAQAENLFTNAFSATVDSLASDPPDLSGEHPDFLNNRTAVTSPAGPPAATVDQIQAALNRDAHDGEAAQADVAAILNQADSGDNDPARLVASTLPLQTPDASGQPAPVDLSLDPQGSSYQPQNPLVDLSLPDTITHDVAVGDQGLRVDVGASDPASADPIAGDNLFYADAAQATDVVLAPISTGLETLYQLRAPSSPDHFQMTLTLPDGASLSPTGDGGAQITREGQTLAAIYPPSATDAAGNPVPVSMTVAGDQLDLEVPHSDPGIQYPISVDPAIDTYSWSANGSGTFSDWIQNKTVGSPYQLKTTCTQNVNCTSGTTGAAGLYVAVPQSSSVTAQSVGAWQYRVPHYGQTTAYISNLNLGPMYFANRGDTNANPFLFAGIYDDNGSYTASQGQTSNALNLYWSLDPGALKTGKQGVFALWSWTSRQLTQWRDAYLGGATLTLGDRESPVIDRITHSGITFQSNGYSDWVDDATPTISADATDKDPANANAGLGIKNFQFSIPYASGNGDVTKNMSCSGANASPCPQSASSGAVSYDTSQMPNGVTVIGVVATDAMSNADVQIPAVRVDHARPRISLSGGLAPGGGSGGAYTLHIDATDGDASGSANWQSGVRQITLSVNGDPVTLSGAGPQNCTPIAGSCPLSVNYTLQPSDYTTPNLHLTVDGTDELGHHALGAGGQTLDWTVPLPDTSIDSGPSGPTNDTTPSFTYSSPDSGASFQCRIDNGAFANCPASDYTITPSLADGQHTFYVRAVDSSGHVDSTPASHSFNVDTVRPVLTASGAIVDGSNPLVGAAPDVGFDATDTGTGVTDVAMSVDAEEVDHQTQDCPDGGCEYNDVLAPDLSSESPGQHSYDLVATDAAGNTSAHISGSFTLDPTPPTMSVSGPLVDSSGEPLTTATADAAISATDNAPGDSGIAKVEVSVDKTVDSTTELPCDPTCSATSNTGYTFTQADWGLGPQNVEVTVTDAAGNSQSDDFDVNEPPPPSPAECPQTSPSVQPSDQVLAPVEAEDAVTQDNWIDGAVKSSISAYDQTSQEQVDPSLATPVDPPTPVDSTGSLSDDTVASVPAGGFNVDQLACLVPAQTTPDEDGVRVANGDSALYANSATDSDTIVRPTASGETAIEVLRSADAPQSFSWQVGISDGYVLHQLADGGVAVIDPTEPAPSDITIPDPPAHTQDPNYIPDVTTQLADADYQIANAEQETGSRVALVFPRPYFVDSSGGSVAGTLEVSGSNTLTASAGTGARALVLNALANAGAPSGAPAYFMRRAPSGVVDQANNFACTFANQQPSGARALYLDWGAAHRFDNGYGTQHFGNDYPNDLIRQALRAAADGYARCYNFNGDRSVRIVYGNNNNMTGNTVDHAFDAGSGQAHTASVLASYENSRANNSHLQAQYRAEKAGVGGDIEPGFQLFTADHSKHLVNGAAQGGGGRYFNDGTANLSGGDNHWDVSDLCEVSFTIGGHRSSIPQIYKSSDIGDWEHVRKNCHSPNWFYSGITWANIWSDYSSPRREWKVLAHASPAPVHDQLLNFTNAAG
jgi:hypothetical protein